MAILIEKGFQWKLRDQGRVLFAKGELYGQLVTMANIYTPNMGQIGFIESCLSKLTEFAERIWTLDGGF